MTSVQPDITVTEVGGPWYEELGVGQVFDSAPALTLTDGHAAVHQAVIGDRLRIALDAELCQRVLGTPERLAHPALVCDVAIGQSTVATERVIANLFYRGLALRRAPVIGDTLTTSTEVVALRDSTPRVGRPPTGLAVLRVHTVDQLGRDVLDFHRCAMLPMREGAARPGHADDIGAIPAELPAAVLAAGVDGWDLAAYRRDASDDPPRLGTRYVVESGDTVSAAPELARLSLNVAAAHHDPAAGGRGRRLVYGGHTIGIALSHVTRALPDLVTVAGWRSCDHLAPVYEGDVLHSAIEVGALEPLGRGGALLDLRVQTDAQRVDGGREAVLDWRLVGVIA
jgi:acyl dehydratase